MKTPVKQELQKGFLQEFKEGYLQQTEKRIRLIDSYIVFLFLLTCFQIVYYMLSHENELFQIMASGVFCTFGIMIVTVCYRIQIDKKTRFTQQKEGGIYFEYFICVLLVIYASIT